MMLFNSRLQILPFLTMQKGVDLGNQHQQYKGPRTIYGIIIVYMASQLSP